MVAAMTDDLDALMSADSPTTPDALSAIRAAAIRRRDLGRLRSDLEARLIEVNKAAEALERTTLPDLFAAAGVARVDVAATGNDAAFSAVLQPYYKANIQASWPAEARDAAFAKLDALGLGDLTKSVVTITFGRDEAASLHELIGLLDSECVRYTVARTVPWTTLTAAVRETYESGGNLDDATLAAIGAVVGRIVKLK
jgi:hypothetical protein